MYDPSGDLHDEQGEPKYTNADKEDEHSKPKQKINQYYLITDERNVIDCQAIMKLKIDHVRADADHVYVYLRTEHD